LKQAIYSLGCIEMYEAKLGFELKQASIYLADTIFEAKLDFEIEIAWQIQLSF